ncbi:MAG: cheBR, partial [Deltaproteobacteria bacterium]|nr:cheBR [Deltaproteobacteria bacterium]
SLQIFATDLNHDAIDRARKGIFPPNISADVSAERLRRFFIKEAGGYRVRKEIRDMVVFATQNVAMDSPFTRLDIIVCRNLLIYLTPELQKKILPLFRFCLNPGGILFLGVAETAGVFTDIFAPLNAKARIYQRRESLLLPATISFPSSFVSARSGTPKELPMLKPSPNLQSCADQLLLQRYTLPAVLVNEGGDILYINGRTGKYLEPASGKVNWNIFAMAREGLRFELTRIFQQAVRQKETVTARGLTVGTNGGTQVVDVTVQHIETPVELQGLVMVVFHDVAAPPAARVRRRAKPGQADSARVAELELELQKTFEELNATREEMQSSQEELKSANEELQSTNEELQSTNEELTTSKEEMQSINEELQSINAEQQAKMEEFSLLSNDMQNLLNSTEIAVVFLDNQLNIRRFTTGTNKLIKLIHSDLGRPLSDIATDLHYPELTAEALEVLRTLVYTEKQIPTNDGRWYTVRIMPYRTMDNVINGVVITYLDITAAKTLQSELSAANEKLQTMLAAAR